MLIPAILCEAGLRNTFSQRICQSDMRFFHFQNFFPEGSIGESGTHAELLEGKGHYAKLWSEGRL